MKTTLDRIEITDQVAYDAWFMTLPEFVNYYRDKNGFALRSQGGTHNLDELYHQVVQEAADGTRQIVRSLSKSSASDWFVSNKKTPSTAAYSDILTAPTAEEEEKHRKEIVNKDSPNSTPVHGRQASSLRNQNRGYLARNRKTLSQLEPEKKQTDRASSRRNRQ